MPEASRGPEQQTATTTQLIRSTWSFDDPAASERRFRELGEPAGFVHEELGECYLLGNAERAKRHFAEAYRELAKDDDFARSEAARLERIGRLGGVL